MRARGLKHIIVTNEFGKRVVAPHAGAWIETTYSHNFCTVNSVAPHAGAWIETDDVNARLYTIYSSRPMRARGLKRIGMSMKKTESMSRPMRARGLKLLNQQISTL